MFKNVLFVVIMFAMSDFMFATTSPTALQKVTGVKEYKYEQKTAGKINYYEVKKSENDVAGYIFDSGGLTDEICGYAGPMRLLIYVDTVGNVKNFQDFKIAVVPVRANNEQLMKSNPLAMKDAIWSDPVWWDKPE